jgi:hypothetical protein
MTQLTRILAVSAALALVLGLLGTPVSVAAQDPPQDGVPLDINERPRIVRLAVPDTTTIKALESAGLDITHDISAAENGTFEVEAILTPSQERDLPSNVTVLQREPARSLDELSQDFFGNVQVQPGQAGAVDGEASGDRAGLAAVVEQGSIRVLRTDWFSNYAGLFLSIEARSANGRDDDLVVTFDDGSGGTASIEMDSFVDAGQYMYHRFDSPQPISAIPDTVTVTSADGSSVTAPTREWSPSAGGGFGRGYRAGFVNDGYMDAVQTTQRIEDLAAQFPGLTEVITLPYRTHGYRREAQAFLGTLTSNAFYLITKAYGHEGGNDYVLEVTNPGTANAPLTVSLDGTTVSVSTATDATGAIVTTAGQVVAALNADPDISAVATAYTYRGNAGNGVILTGTVPFTDGLNAPESIPREPFEMKAIRISGQRQGAQQDKVGVLVYCQEHAREWVTPLVCLETAERLLRNYGSDSNTTRLVNNLDIFIIPTVNPDGTNYSMYDYNFQRKNMANYCDPSNSDRLRWSGQLGVDLNRNFTIGSRFDGYSGGSASCTSETYSGPAESSEFEASNERWLVEEYDNILFTMNTHSHGGYFMWSPGAYIESGRIPLPRPSLAVEDYFFQASEHILGRIRQHRDTVVHPGRTGPVIDVLYSAAGNSADDHFYFDQQRRDPEIYAWNFEVGAERWTGSQWQSQGFQPDFATEGFPEAMEFANGMIGFLQVANMYANDDDEPRSTVNVQDERLYHAPVDVVFTVDEPATIYYTTDGSRPDLSSPTLERVEFRDGAETIRIEETTTLRWFAVDIAGNVELGYEPDGTGGGYNEVTIRIGP